MVVVDFSQQESTLVYLDEAAVRHLLPPEEAVRAVRDAYVALDRGTVEAPLRAALPARDGLATTLVMPSRGRAGAAGVRASAAGAESGSEPAGRPAPDSNDAPTYVAVKVVSVAPGNRERGLPVTPGVVLLFDAVTGQPLVAMDGTALTAIRTGAASGAATQALARPDADTLAVIGAGGQAWDQVACILAVRPIRQVLFFARTRERAERLARRVAEAYPQVKATVAASAAEAVRDADVVCCATTATEPVFPADAVRPGTHVNGVGSFRPDMVELPPELLRPPVFVESREIALAESGEILAALRAGRLREDDLVPVGRVLAGEHPGRRGPDDVTVFKSAGTAAQDLFAAARVWENYRAERSQRTLRDRE